MNRYARQIILPQVGKVGQEALKKAKVLLVGAGGLGLPCAQSLVAAGVGQLTIVDDDFICLSNLQRQILFCEKDIGQSKVKVAAEKLSLQNSDVLVQAFHERLNLKNARLLVANHDLVIDGSDNFTTKFLINDVCLLEKKPWVYGSVSRFEGQLAVFWGDKGSCYRCLYEKAPKSKIENCAEQGVFGAVTGIVGNYQALEALKMIIESKVEPRALAPCLGSLKIFDFLTMEQQSFVVPKKQNCCCAQPYQIELKEEEEESCDFVVEKKWENFEQDDQKKILFDVRSFEEFQKGHHPQAEFWVGQSLEKLTQLSTQNISIYLCCLSGKRARAKCIELRKNGVSAFYIGEHIGEQYL